MNQNAQKTANSKVEKDFYKLLKTTVILETTVEKMLETVL